MRSDTVECLALEPGEIVETVEGGHEPEGPPGNQSAWAIAAEAEGQSNGCTDMEEDIEEGLEGNGLMAVGPVEEANLYSHEAETKEYGGEHSNCWAVAADGLGEEAEFHELFDGGCSHDEEWSGTSDGSVLTQENHEHNLEEESGAASEKAVGEEGEGEHGMNFKI